MTYSQAMEFLDSCLNYEKVVAYPYDAEAFSLERMRHLLNRLGNPHQRYPTLHVAGTKGKGSTCAFAASILKSAGHRVGLYTSPHLLSFRERIQINGQPISEKDLARVVEEIQPWVDRHLTYFEVTTACAFLYFAWEGVDVAVIEVGLGGRLDSTNVLTPEVTAITSISLDHMAKLGNTLEAIAQEKAGIIKPSVPLILAPQEPSVKRLIQSTAQKQKAPLHDFEKEVQIDAVEMNEKGTTFSLKTPTAHYPSLTTPILGRHQVVNAGVAVRMVELWAERHPERVMTIQAVRDGLARVNWPGRCQIVSTQPLILLDGAHNRASAEALRATVQELFPDKKITLIFGASIEKDLQGMADLFGPWVQRLILAEAQIPRAESRARLVEAFRPWHPVPTVALSVREALEAAQEKISSHEMIVVAGSLFVVAEVLRALGLGRGRRALFAATQ